MDPTGSALEAARRRPALRRLLVDGVQLAVLTSFAIAQPIFDLLGRNATFFVAHRASSGDIIRMTVLLLIVPPAVLLVLEAAVGSVSERARRRLHEGLIGLLAALVFVPPLARTFGLAWPLAALVAAALAWGAAMLYRRRAVLSRGLMWGSFAPFAFGGIFLFATPVNDLVFASQTVDDQGVVRSDTPVVFVIFDEFSLASILTPSGDINAHRFPNLADMARRGTWYPNATTVSNATAQAVPALLSGTLPPPDAVPTAQHYPGNVFTMVGDSYSMHVREDVTHLCPPDRCRERETGPPPASLLKDTAIAYLHSVLPEDAAQRWLPAITDRWTGFGEDGPSGSEDHEEGDAAVDNLGIFEEFVEEIGEDKRRALYFLHLKVPHRPWRYLPDGRYYTRLGISGFDNAGVKWGTNRDLVDHGMQRYLLQAKLADRMVGRLVDRLEEQGMYDDTMIVLASDHGVAFTPGQSIRFRAPDTDPEIFPVPLFVKYPGQEGGSVDRRLAETIDVVPTIADVLDAQLFWDPDGTSLLAEEPPRERRANETARPPIRLSFEGDLRRYASRIERTFGDGSGEADLYGFGPARSLVGRRVASLDVAAAPPDASARLDEPALFLDVDPRSDLVPARVTGTLEGVPAGTALAVAVNGMVAGTGTAFIEGGATRFSLMANPATFERGRNDVVLLTVEEGKLERVLVSNLVQYRVVVDEEGAATEIVGDGGDEFRPGSRYVEGRISVRRNPKEKSIYVGGWALDVERREPASAFLVVVGDKVVTTAVPDRPGDGDVPDEFRLPEGTLMGFDLAIPEAVATDHIVVLAIVDGGFYRLR